MRAAVIATLLAAFVSAGCSARQASPPTRETPTGTVEMFKVFARRGDTAGEWSVLSPGFKDRLSRQQGRRLDAADYGLARNQLRSNSQAQLAEKMLQTAIVTQTQPIGPNKVRALVATAGGPFAKSAWIEMVKIEDWELWIHGQNEPYQGTMSDPSFLAQRQPDGSFVLTANGVEAERIPANQVRDYKVVPRWYVDSLGSLEQQFAGGG